MHLHLIRRDRKNIIFDKQTLSTVPAHKKLSNLQFAFFEISTMVLPSASNATDMPPMSPLSSQGASKKSLRFSS
ncbi:MAG: hypothetical protein B6D68_00990 [spirochete symbiont of Stewartia floridana]|nr:MAG: hypothetical protein B6D68_00990 [spirochete symbiont of Stewartia floridana]